MNNNMNKESFNNSCYINHVMNQFSEKTGLDIEDCIEVYEDFYKYITSTLETLKNTIVSEDYILVRYTAHNLKGAAGTLILESIKIIASEIELAAINMDCNKIKELIVNLEEIYKSLLTKIEK